MDVPCVQLILLLRQGPAALAAIKSLCLGFGSRDRLGQMALKALKDGRHVGQVVIVLSSVGVVMASNLSMFSALMVLGQNIFFQKMLLKGLSAKNKAKTIERNFSAIQRREALSSDVRIRDAISWHPCGSGHNIYIYINHPRVKIKDEISYFFFLPVFWIDDIINELTGNSSTGCTGF